VVWGGGEGDNEICEGVFEREILFPKDFLGVQPPYLGSCPCGWGPHSTKVPWEEDLPCIKLQDGGFWDRGRPSREGLCHRKDHRWFLMRSSWIRGDLSHGKGPAVGASPCKTPQSGPCTVPQHKAHLRAHFAGLAFLHLSQLASTLFKRNNWNPD